MTGASLDHPSAGPTRYRSVTCEAIPPLCTPVRSSCQSEYVAPHTPCSAEFGSGSLAVSVALRTEGLSALRLASPLKSFRAEVARLLLEGVKVSLPARDWKPVLATSSWRFSWNVFLLVEFPKPDAAGENWVEVASGDSKILRNDRAAPPAHPPQFSDDRGQVAAQAVP